MASGNFISNTGTNLNLYVTWSSTPNTTTNQSTVTANVYMRSYTISGTALADSYITINGNKKSFAGISLNKTSSSLTDTLLTTHTVTVDHNTDGTKSITIKANLEFNGKVSGTYLSDVTASKTVDLDNIPRASGLTVATSINTGSSLTATISPANSAFTHKIEYYVGGVLMADSGVLSSGTNTYTRTVEHSWMPFHTNAIITVRLWTYNNGTSIGHLDKYVDANVPSTIIPVVNSITPSLINGLGGYYVEGKSQVKLTVSATAGSGSTLSSYVFSGQNIYDNSSTTTSTSSSITSSVIRANGTLTYGVVAKDGRPNRQSTQATTSITVYPYSNPQISSITAQRCLADGTLSNDGTYAKVTVKASYSPVNGANTRVVTLYSSKDNYTTGTVVLASATTNDTYTGVYGSGFAIGSNYTIRAVITDKYNTGTSIQKSATLQMAQRAVNIAKYGNGLAVGGFSSITNSNDTPKFECHWDGEFKNNLSVDGDISVNGRKIDASDTGWISLNKIIKYRVKNGFVFVACQSSGDVTLTKGSYTTVGALPQELKPGITIPFTFHCMGSSTFGPSAYIADDGRIQIYVTADNIQYWMFSVMYPL